MSFALAYLLAQVFVPLIVVPLMVASRKRANGPLIACSAAAILSFAALWLLSVSQGSLFLFASPLDGALALGYVLYAVAGVTGQAAWVLALCPAALARQTRWVAGLAAAQVVANAVLLLASNPCLVAEATNNLSTNGCEPLAPLTLHLVLAIWLVSPAVALAYALLTRRAAQLRTPPTDPAMAPFGEAPEDESALEVRTERL